MTKKELLDKLTAASTNLDTEAAHGDADDALIEFIDDLDIKEAYENVPKWYA